MWSYNHVGNLWDRFLNYFDMFWIKVVGVVDPFHELTIDKLLPLLPLRLFFFGIFLSPPGFVYLSFDILNHL